MIAMLAFGAGVGILAAILFWALLRLGRVYELHHGYYGLALCLLPWGGPAVNLVGLALLADDAWQHARQLRDPAYRSPLHILYRATLYRVAVWALTWYAVRSVTK